MTGPDRTESKSAAYNNEGAPNGVTRVKIGEPSFKFLFAVLVVVSVLTVTAIVLTNHFSISALVVAMLAIGLALTVMLRWRVVILRRRIDGMVNDANEETPGTIARTLIHRELASESYTTVCLQFVKSLAAEGKVGETIMLWSKTPCDEIQPINEPFEAKLLDEADGAYEELDAALSGDEQRIEETAAQMRLAREVPFGLRRIKRNVRMHGGRWRIWSSLFAITMLAFLSWSQNQFRWFFWIQVGSLLLLLYVPFGITWWKPQQWWAIPGGIVYRWAGLFDRKGKVHVFNRRTSVLCIYEGWPHNWVLTVADRNRSAMRYATISEVNFLLRAWLSPLEPPPVEKLVDLT
jgi:hypothetical protein